MDLSKIPSFYHDLSHVFSKSQALSLPRHRPYDYSTGLVPNATLPSSRLYNLSGPEKESMKKYIEKSLDLGIIRPHIYGQENPGHSP